MKGLLQGNIRANLLSVLLIALVTAQPAWSQGGQHPSRTGKVVGVDLAAGKLQYEVHFPQLREYKTFAVKVGPDCPVTIDGREVELRDLRPGQVVQVQYSGPTALQVAAFDREKPGSASAKKPPVPQSPPQAETPLPGKSVPASPPEQNSPEPQNAVETVGAPGIIVPVNGEPIKASYISSFTRETVEYTDAHGEKNTIPFVEVKEIQPEKRRCIFNHLDRSFAYAAPAATQSGTGTETGSQSGAGSQIGTGTQAIILFTKGTQAKAMLQSFNTNSVTLRVGDKLIDYPAGTIQVIRTPDGINVYSSKRNTFQYWSNADIDRALAKNSSGSNTVDIFGMKLDKKDVIIAIAKFIWNGPAGSSTGSSGDTSGGMPPPAPNSLADTVTLSGVLKNLKGTAICDRSIELHGSTGAVFGAITIPARTSPVDGTFTVTVPKTAVFTKVHVSATFTNGPAAEIRLSPQLDLLKYPSGTKISLIYPHKSLSGDK
jgi:hypothetical protein